MTKILKTINERCLTSFTIAVVKIYTIGALIIIAGGLLLLYFGSAQIGFDAIAIGFSIIALAFASISGMQMFALTHLNFDEKMAMMTGYKNTINELQDRKEKIGNKINNWEDIEDLMNNNRWKEITDLINERQNTEEIIGYTIERCKYDLLALSHLRYWAERKVKEDLINNYVVKIIDAVQIKDTCDNNREKICGLIEISLKITPLIDFRHFKIASTYQELKGMHEKICSHTREVILG